MNTWPLQDLQALSGALDISLVELLVAAGEIESGGRSHQPDPDDAQTSFRLATLQRLEPLLRQLPTAAYAVQHHNLPANQLLKVLQPIDALLETWDVEPLGTVGTVVPFDPSWQQSLTEETYERDTPVSIRYVGYRVGNRIWLKAQVRAVREQSIA